MAKVALTQSSLSAIIHGGMMKIKALTMILINSLNIGLQQPTNNQPFHFAKNINYIKKRKQYKNNLAK